MADTYSSHPSSAALVPAAALKPFNMKHAGDPEKLRRYAVSTMFLASDHSKLTHYTAAYGVIVATLAQPLFVNEIQLRMKAADLAIQTANMDAAADHMEKACDAVDSKSEQHMWTDDKTIKQLATLGHAFLAQGEPERVRDVLYVAEKLDIDHDRLDEIEYRLDCMDKGIRPRPWSAVKPGWKQQQRACG